VTVADPAHASVTRKPRSAHARAWLELARVSNLPTVWSNVLTGLAIGAVAIRPVGTLGTPPFPWLRAVVVGFGVSLLYIGGMILNDVADAKVDARERPGRPIPSGRVSRARALVAGVAAMLVGAAIIAVYGSVAAGVAVALAACIIAYDLTHARWTGAVVLMGLCRGLVYVAGIAVMLDPEVSVRLGVAHVAMVVSITAYTVLLTIVARHEANPAAKTGGWTIGALPAVVVPVGALVWSDRYGFASAGLVALLLLWLLWAWWLLSRRGREGPRAPAAVMAMIAGMSLADAYFLSLLARPGPALLAFGCFMLTVGGQRRIAGS